MYLLDTNVVSELRKARAGKAYRGLVSRRVDVPHRSWRRLMTRGTMNGRCGMGIMRLPPSATTGHRIENHYRRTSLQNLMPTPTLNCENVNESTRNTFRKRYPTST